MGAGKKNAGSAMNEAGEGRRTALTQKCQIKSIEAMRA